MFVFKAVRAEKLKALWQANMMKKARDFDLNELDADNKRQLEIILTDAKPREPEIVE